MAIRERGSSFQVSVTIKGKRYRKDFPNKVAAAQAEAEAERAAQEGRPPPWVAPQAPGELAPSATWQDILDACKATDWARAATGMSLGQTGQLVINAIGPLTRPAALSEDTLEDLVSGWFKGGNTGSTINRKLSVLRTMCRRAVRKKLMPAMPKMPWQSENAIRMRYFTRGEEAEQIAFFRTIGEHTMADILAVAYDTGARRGELLKLLPEHLRDDGSSILLTTRKGGRERSRLVPLTKRAREILLARAQHTPRGKPLFSPMSGPRMSHLWNRMRDFLNKLDEDDYVFHCVRHTYASRLVQARVELQVVKELLGHANITMTLRYAHLQPDNLKAAVAALEMSAAA